MTADDMQHLSPEVVAAWVDGLLTDPERAAAEAHLASCSACRQEIVEVRGLLAGAPRTGRRVPLPLQLAAAAVLALAIGIPASRTLRYDPVTPTADRAQPSSGNRLSAVAPRPGAEVSGAPTFAWNAADPGSLFRVTLVDALGSTLWTTETGDTSVTLPADIPLISGTTYFWYVDALGVDGRTMTSGALRFSVR